MSDDQVEGLDELLRKLDAMSQDVRSPIVLTSLRAGAMLIVNEAKRLAPFDTGTLRRSIHEQTRWVSPGEAVAYIGVPNLSDKGDDLGYAVYQEFGTSRMAAHPYLRPAYNTQKRAAVQEVADALEELVTKHAS